MITLEIDKWAAKRCGVRVVNEDTWKWFYPNQSNYHEKGKWTLTDPRCMQIFRERFHINTGKRIEEKGGGFVALSSKIDAGIHDGKTIPEAEQACAVAIYKTEQEKG